jgi:transcription antitermination factor NusA-like protein
MSELKPFLVRLRPDVRELLVQAAQERKKPIASVINDELRSALGKTGNLNQRLSQLIG